MLVDRWAGVPVWQYYSRNAGAGVGDRPGLYFMTDLEFLGSGFRNCDVLGGIVGCCEVQGCAAVNIPQLRLSREAS